MDLVPLNSVIGLPGRRFFAGGSLAFVLAAWIVLGAVPALADEFAVGVVTEPVTSGSTTSPFVDGFQLAVDQSPDVSHPPDTEGGDHLGSMDVVMFVVDASLSPDELVTATMAPLNIDRVPIVVVDGPAALASLVGPVTDSGTVLIALSESGEPLLTQELLIFAGTDQDAMQLLLTDRVPGFEKAYFGAYGRSASPAAVRGYLAGRLVDLSVEATARDPFDSETIVAVLAQATGALPASPEIVGGDEGPVSLALPNPPQATASTIAAAQDGGAAVTDSLSRFSAAAFAALAVVTAAAAWLVRRMRLPSRD
ncbi:MAG: hypothetical protein BMS9Abin17_1243 [Acidimicrobiia bacterium]|nr:MAG: hypothetical protein BMS9Abin17_1243 [Acidimicrobiia bacterium]